MAPEFTWQPRPDLDSHAKTCSTCPPAEDLEAAAVADLCRDLRSYCRLERLLDILEKKYALQVVAVLDAYGRLRYSEIEAQLQTASSSTLTKRLDALAASAILERRRYNEAPPRVEYALTPRGHELTELLQPLLEWTAASTG